jgi:hypothetical protein
MPTPLERQVLAKFLEGDEPALAVLREQLGGLVVTSRESSSAGFFTHFRVAPGAPGLTPAISTQLNDVFVESPSLKHGGGFVLWVAKGYLHMLEGFTFDEPWAEPTDFRLHYFHGDQREWDDVALRLRRDTQL